jgi:antitoxin HigA-1
MVRVPTHRAPSHPGEMLLREFLEPLGLTQTELAERMEIPFQRVNSLVNGRRGVTPDTALRLSKVFGTTPGFWMNHQLRWDLFYAEREAKRALERIEPVPREDLVGTG